MLRIGPQRRHHHVDVQRGPVRQLSLPDVPVGVAFQRFHRHTGTQVDPGVALHLGGDIADHPAERPDQWCAGAFRDRHVQSEITTDRGHLGADEARADDQHPLRPGLQRRLQLGRVIAGAQRVQALQLGLFGVEPRAGTDAGRDQQPVVGHLVTVGEQHLPVVAVQSGGRHAQAPVRVDLPQARQLGVTRRHPSLEHLLGQRRPVVRLVDLVTNDGQRASEPLVAQRLRGAQPGQRRTDDHDPTLRLEGPYEVGDQRVRAHFVVLSAGGSISAMIACTGQDATARATR